MNTIEAIAARMSADDIAQLKAIWEPTAVATPRTDTWAHLCVTPEGELRCYSRDDDPFYLRSLDGGLSWKTVPVPEGAIRSFVPCPYTGRVLSLVPTYIDNRHTTQFNRYEHYDDPAPSFSYAFPHAFYSSMQPLALSSRRRLLVAGDLYNEKGLHTGVYYSDDDGDSWTLTEVEPTPPALSVEPHKGPRWQNCGIEPTIVELQDGRLLMALRTSQDYHYFTYSEDGGATWTKPEPSPFHSTLTKPHFCRLQDGRLLFFYNNTRPLPEQEKSSVFPPLDKDEQAGVWEDVFTNRDSNCVVVSEDDGKTWRGFRELYLNPLRNACDFRTSGFTPPDLDKSVHQMQALELPFGKILVQVGQHDFLRKLMIFDINWLYETARSEDFRLGLTSVSTQTYVKSVSGGYQGNPGHCAWNRTNGALLVPDPAGDRSEVLLLRNTADEWLVSQVQGLCWNFPAAQSGTLTVRLWVRGNGVRLSLLDHWMNPIDTTVARYAAYTAEITTTAGGWQDISLAFTPTEAVLAVNGTPTATLPKAAVATPNGLCFFHAQTLTETGDTAGTLIKSFAFNAAEGNTTETARFQ